MFKTYKGKAKMGMFFDWEKMNEEKRKEKMEELAHQTAQNTSMVAVQLERQAIMQDEIAKIQTQQARLTNALVIFTGFLVAATIIAAGMNYAVVLRAAKMLTTADSIAIITATIGIIIILVASYQLLIRYGNKKI